MLLLRLLLRMQRLLRRRSKDEWSGVSDQGQLDASSLAPEFDPKRERCEADCRSWKSWNRVSVHAA